MNYRYCETTQKKGYVFAYFDLSKTFHIYDMIKKSCLCGHYKSDEPIEIYLPTGSYWGFEI